MKELLGRLIDDAGQFPPAAKPLDQAVADHLAARVSERAWIVGRFLCPASRVEPELPLPLGVISDGEDWEAELDDAVSFGADSYELRDPGADAYPILAGAGMPVFVEGADLEQLKAAGLRAKLRCGGATVPTAADVAAFIARCRELELPFKATQGLHHAVNTGSEHGFLNLLAAAGLPEHLSLEPVIADSDPAAFAFEGGLSWRGRAVDVAQARALMTAFGSCSLEEPISELEALGAFAELG
jgi:hypothetical protein